MFWGYRGQANVYDGRCFVAHTTCCVLFAHMRCNFIKIVNPGITNLRMRMVFVVVKLFLNISTNARMVLITNVMRMQAILFKRHSLYKFKNVYHRFVA